MDGCRDSRRQAAGQISRGSGTSTPAWSEVGSCVWLLSGVSLYCPSCDLAVLYLSAEGHVTGVCHYIQESGKVPEGSGQKDRTWLAFQSLLWLYGRRRDPLAIVDSGTSRGLMPRPAPPRPASQGWS